MGIQIHELATKSGNLSSSDYLVTDNGTVTAKIDYTKLAKAIVEQYNGSTLAGSAQTLQNALNGLNTGTQKVTTPIVIPANSDLLALDVGEYYGDSTNMPSYENCPTSASFKLTVSYRIPSRKQYEIRDAQGSVFYNTQDSSTTYLGWIKEPSRNEMNASFANYGCKNLLPNTATTETINGVTFTVNSDGSVTANGTATANAEFIVGSMTTHEGIVSPSPSGYSTTTYRLVLRFYRDGSMASTVTIPDTGYTIPSGYVTANDTMRLSVFVSNGQTVSNLRFYPMIRSANITDDTYVPYAPNNAELYDMIKSLQ